MNKDLGACAHKTVLITGASAGIGLACARHFAEAGAQVILLARGAERLEAAVREIISAGGRAVGWVADVGIDAECDRVLAQVQKEYGGLDVLVNNAGLHHRGPFLENDAEALAAMVDVNLRSPIRMTRLAMPLLLESRGAVVNVASLAGCVPVPNSAVYSATKFGIRAFSLALAAELKDTGVTVSAVSPGPVDTGFILDNLDAVTDITLSQPMVTADEVARAVLKCADRGTLEIKMPRASGWLATIAYLFPFLKRWLQPLLERKGARAKKRLRATLAAEGAPDDQADEPWLLLTGFGPFPGVEQNPTELIAARLDGRTIGGVRIKSEVLEVNFEGVADRLGSHLAASAPIATVHLGVAVQAREVRVERRAVNLKEAAIPDVSGQHFSGSPIDKKMATNAIQETSFDVDSVVAAVRGKGFAARGSDDAGRYVCNCTYYHALRIFGARSIPSLFVHIPPVGSRPEENENDVWTSDRLTQGVEVALKATLDALGTVA